MRGEREACWNGDGAGGVGRLGVLTERYRAAGVVWGVVMRGLLVLAASLLMVAAAAFWMRVQDRELGGPWDSVNALATWLCLIVLFLAGLGRFVERLSSRVARRRVWPDGWVLGTALPMVLLVVGTYAGHEYVSRARGMLIWDPYTVLLLVLPAGLLALEGAVVGVMGVVRMVLWLRNRPVAAGRCRACGYDLRGVPGRARCSECGTAV